MTPSKPSGPPNPLSDPGRSTISWTIPQPADVLSYAYLWADEAAAGQKEGLKDRPVVVVVARRVVGDRTELMVAPVTHSEPLHGDGVELPQRVKEYLGLDDQRSWVVTTELNRFNWPGPDIRLAGDGDSPLYGAIPAKLFERIRRAISGRARAHKLQMPKRTE